MSDIVYNDNLINMVGVSEPLYSAEFKKKKLFFIRTLIVGIFVIAVLLAETLFVTFYFQNVF